MFNILSIGKNIKMLFPFHKIFITYNWDIVGDESNIKPDQLYEIKGYDETQQKYPNSNINICNVFVTEVITVESLQQEYLSEENAIYSDKNLKSDIKSYNNEFKSSIDLEDIEIDEVADGE